MPCDKPAGFGWPLTSRRRRALFLDEAEGGRTDPFSGSQSRVELESLRSADRDFPEVRMSGIEQVIYGSLCSAIWHGGQSSIPPIPFCQRPSRAQNQSAAFRGRRSSTRLLPAIFPGPSGTNAAEHLGTNSPIGPPPVIS